MSDVSVDADLALARLGLLAHGVDAIERIADSALTDSQDLAETLRVISVIIETINIGFQGGLTVEAAREEIDSLRRTVMLDIEVVADDKFDNS